jgi:hypothetical protein
MEGYDGYQSPTVGYQERVYYHEDLTTQDGKATALVENPRFPMPGGATCSLTLAVTWATSTLPRLVEWKMPGTEVYVLGVEPGNCYPDGRVAERERGTLVMLEPGHAVAYDVELALIQRNVVGG